MKITLINPTTDASSYGLRTMSACLKKAGHKTNLAILGGTVSLYSLKSDVEYSYSPETLEKIAKICNNSDMVGISVLSNYFTRAIQLTQFLHTMNIPVIWGGIHATARPKECLEYADAVCVGEGEEAMVELLNKLENGKPIHKTKNICFKGQKNPVRPLADLNSFPIPDYDFRTNWIFNNGKIVRLTKEIFRKQVRYSKPDNSLGAGYKIICTRGCPHACNYCCNNVYRNVYKGVGNGWTVRRRDTEHILRELEYVKKKLDFVEIINFMDDTFLAASTQTIKDFCREYKERIGLSFRCLTSPLTINEEKMDALLDAGLIFINMGIQSGSERTLFDVYDRKTTVDSILKAAKICSKAPRPPIYDFIMDNPFETDEDIIQTIELIKKLPKPRYISSNSLIFFPGTELNKRAKKEGIITEKDVIHKQMGLQATNYFNLIMQLYRKNAPDTLMKFLTNRSVIRLMNNKLTNSLIKRWNTHSRNKYFNKVKHEQIN